MKAILAYQIARILHGTGLELEELTEMVNFFREEFRDKEQDIVDKWQEEHARKIHAAQHNPKVLNVREQAWKLARHLEGQERKDFMHHYISEIGKIPLFIVKDAFP